MINETLIENVNFSSLHTTELEEVDRILLGQYSNFFNLSVNGSEPSSNVVDSTNLSSSPTQTATPHLPNFRPCETVQSRFPDYVDRGYVQILFGLLYGVVWSLGVGGNILVIYVACARRTSNVSFSVRTVYILNLAISDLLNGLFSLPITAVTIFARVWVFPILLCYPIGTIQGSSIFISSFTLTLIAIDRYFLIVRPTQPSPLPYRFAKYVMIGFWIMGYVITSPMTVFSRPITYRGFCGTFCEERWPGKTRQLYGMCTLVIQFGLPLLISVFCYVNISQKIAKQAKKRQKMKLDPMDGKNDVVVTSAEDCRLSRRRRHTNRMMLIMVVCFVIAYFPLNFVNIIRDFKLIGIVPLEFYMTIFAFGHFIAMTSIMWNPLIYGWFNEPFRNAVKSLFNHRRRKTGLKNSYQPETGTTTLMMNNNDRFSLIGGGGEGGGGGGGRGEGGQFFKIGNKKMLFNTTHNKYREGEGDANGTGTWTGTTLLSTTENDGYRIRKSPAPAADQFLAAASKKQHRQSCPNAQTLLIADHSNKNNDNKERQNLLLDLAVFKQEQQKQHRGRRLQRQNGGEMERSVTLEPLRTITMDTGSTINKVKIPPKCSPEHCSSLSKFDEDDGDGDIELPSSFITTDEQK